MAPRPGAPERIYRHLPVWGQHAAVTAYGAYRHWLRFGPGFEAFAEAYRRRERFSAERWTDWQRPRLDQVLRTAASRVPFYRAHWTADQKRAAREGRLRDLPLLEKETLRRDPYALARDDEAAPRSVFTTSGSTGTPVASLWTNREVRESLAVREVRSAGWAGVSFRMPRATISGRIVEPDSESRGPFHRFNAVERQVYLSAFHLRPEHARQYALAMRKHGVRWLTGYPMSICLLAQHMVHAGVEPPRLDAVIPTGETLTPEMRAVIERAFQCRAWDQYGTVEHVIFASECEAGSLHVSPDVSVVEILRPNGEPCEPEEVGEVVATCLVHDRQLFVRYRLGDVAAWSGSPCACGRGMPVIRAVAGRVEDVIVGPDGRCNVRFGNVFVSGVRVVQGQIVQEARDRIRVRVIPDAGYDESDVETMTARVRQRVGSSVHVEVETVAHISSAPSGKFPAVVSRIGNGQA